MLRRICLLLLLFLFFTFPTTLYSQQNSLANIYGELRVLRGDFPSHQIQVELRLHGARITSVYADTEGKFGFSNLIEGEYHLVINDEGYEPVDERLEVRPDISAVVMALLTLRPREKPQPHDLAARATGSNVNIIDAGEYNKRFPKKAIHEYDKGLESAKNGDHQEAISHYQRSLRIAPEYYPAHNNLGSEYVSKSDFADARKEFEAVIRLNKSDAAAYFNLSNVCMLMGQLNDARQYLSEGMRREPDSALGQFLLGSLDLRAGKLDQAEVALRRAIQVSPVMAQAHLQLVNVLLQRGRKMDAENELRAFLTAFPDSSFTPKARQLLKKLERPN